MPRCFSCHFPSPQTSGGSWIIKWGHCEYNEFHGAKPFLRNSKSSSQSKNTTFFYGIQMVITVFTRARNWIPFWARWIQSTYSHPLSLIFISILSSNLHLCLPSVCLSQNSYACYTPCSSQPPWLDIKWTCRHQCMAVSQVAAGADGVQIWRVTA